MIFAVVVRHLENIRRDLRRAEADADLQRLVVNRTLEPSMERLLALDAADRHVKRLRGRLAEAEAADPMELAHAIVGRVVDLADLARFEARAADRAERRGDSR